MSNDQQQITKKATITEVNAPKEGSHFASITVLLSDKEGLPAGYGKTPKLLVDTKVWSLESLEKDMKEELESELTFEISVKDKGNTNWLIKWNGKEKEPFQPKSKSGGKGGYSKTPEEIHAASIGGIVKSSLEATASLGVKAEGFIDSFNAISQAAITTYYKGIDVAKQLSAPKSEGEAK
jgi:hypothetical protein